MDPSTFPRKPCIPRFRLCTRSSRLLTSRRWSGTAVSSHPPSISPDDLYINGAVFLAACPIMTIWLISLFIVLSGSSRGRGNRAASWFQDYINQRAGDDAVMTSLVLEGGIKLWQQASEKHREMMDEYDESVWKE